MRRPSATKARNVIRIEKAVTTESDAEQPRTSGRDRASVPWVHLDETDRAPRGVRECPTVEPGRGRTAIHEARERLARSFHGVLAKIAQHVTEGGLHLARRDERAAVVAIREHPPEAPERSIETARDADAEPLDAAGEISPARRFDDQVNVIRKHGKLSDAPRWPILSACNRATNRRKRTTTAQTRHAARHAKRDMHGMRRRMRRAPQVRHAGT